jgi:hypothetical protein
MQMTIEPRHIEEQEQVFQYTVNDKPQSTTQHTLTPAELLSNAGVDPAKNYLVQIIGGALQSHRHTPHKPIQICQHMKFASVFAGLVLMS